LKVGEQSGIAQPTFLRGGWLLKVLRPLIKIYL